MTARILPSHLFGNRKKRFDIPFDFIEEWRPGAPVAGPVFIPAAGDDLAWLSASHTLIPRFRVEAGAGFGREVGQEEIDGHLAMRTQWIRAAMGLDPGKVAIVTAKGESMEPAIMDGDSLLLDLREIRTIDPFVYLIRMDNRIAVKRVAIQGSTAWILSDNPAHAPEQVAVDEVHILGRVVWIGRQARAGRELRESPVFQIV